MQIAIDLIEAAQRLAFTCSLTESQHDEPGKAAYHFLISKVAQVGLSVQRGVGAHTTCRGKYHLWIKIVLHLFLD